MIKEDLKMENKELPQNYIDGKQELPEKSVVITVDDGDPSFFELAVPIIQKYKIPTTSFVITYWYGNRANDKQEYVSYQSHSYDMHKAGSNGKGVMLSWDYDKIKGTAVLRGKPAKSGRLFLCCLQIDKCTTNTYAVIGAQRMRNMGKGGC